MPAFSFETNLLRQGEGHDAERVGYVELFFDLVFVFAVTQLSHELIAHPDLPTLGQTLMLGLAVWWVWICTVWVTNWLDPERGAVRGMLIVLMLLGLLLASAIPGAFGDKSLLFAGSLVAIQVGRSLFTIACMWRHWPENATNFVRITIWLCASGLFWIGGALAADPVRPWLWLVAIAIDYLGPRARFWVPGLGSSRTETWAVHGPHVAERFSLFIIIVLGESIIVTGSAFGEIPLTLVTLLAFLAAFASTVLMWLLFFARTEHAATQYISEAAETGLIARIAYTYLPVLLTTGIFLTAVADEIVLLHPLGHDDVGHADLWTAGLIGGAGSVFLVGNLLFRRATGGAWTWSHLAGAVALAVLPVGAMALSPLALSWLSNGVLLAVLIADELTTRRRTPVPPRPGAEASSHQDPTLARTIAGDGDRRS